MNQSDIPTSTPHAAPLDALVGRWRSRGRTVPGRAEPAIEIAGSDIYEWLAGGFFLVHHVDVRVGGEEVKVIEMIGPYDPASRTCPMRSFDNQGNFVTMRASVAGDGTWTFTGESERATLAIADDRRTMKATWERADDEDGSGRRIWTDWMEMSFTKEAKN